MQQLRECRLADTEKRNVDLRSYEDEIMRIINETVPNKNPKVYRDRFTTSPLTKGEAIMLGRALSKSADLAPLGKSVTTFRLFDGRNTTDPTDNETPKGGRMK